MNLDWKDRAACKGVSTDAFFPEGTGVSQAAAARSLEVQFCRICPVRAVCLTFAVEDKDAQGYGVWAGTTPAVRKAMARKRIRVKCPDCRRWDPVRQTSIKDGYLVIHQVCLGCGTSWLESSTRIPETGAA